MITANTGTDVSLNFWGVILMANVAVCLAPDQKAQHDSAGWWIHKKTYHGGRDGPIKKVNLKGI